MAFLLLNVHYSSAIGKERPWLDSLEKNCIVIMRGNVKRFLARKFKKGKMSYSEYKSIKKNPELDICNRAFYISLYKNKAIKKVLKMAAKRAAWRAKAWSQKKF